MDDDWIDDGDVDIQEDLCDEINLGEGTSSLYTEKVENQSATLKNILMNTDKEEQEARLISRKMKKEQDRIAKKFKIITPAEFEASLN